jgi:hypothetical protein
MSERGITTTSQVALPHRVSARKRVGGTMMLVGGLFWLTCGPVLAWRGFGRTLEEAFPWLVMLGIGAVCMIVGKLIAGPTASNAGQPAVKSQGKSHAQLD